MNRRKNLILRKLVDSVSPFPVDVVIEGETGSGKDTLAQTIHKLSEREGPFIAVNCAAIPETLAESELFGVTAGAYTGAKQSRAGYIEAADKGTLYLDEIDSMPLSLQAKLLRVVENRGIERLGSTEFRAVDVRIIVSTKTPMLELVKENKFRQDLYYRFNTVILQLPPLRSRPYDVIPLFNEFTEIIAEKLNKEVPVCSPELCQKLLTYSWPGNIRELRGAAERYLLGIPPLPDAATSNKINSNSLKQTLQDLERILITDVLSRHDGCIDKATTELKIPKRTLYHRIKTLGVNIVSDP